METTISCVSCLGEEAIAFQVKLKPLKQVREVEQPVAAPLQYFEFVIESLDKAAGLSVQEIIGDRIEMMVQDIRGSK